MNKTTKILIAIAIIIILAVLVYIFCLGRPVNDEQNKEWKRYYRKDLGFSVEYNDNNIIEREKDGMTLIYIGENQAHQTEWYDAYLLYFDWFEYDQEISLKRFVENKKKESELYFSETSDFEEIELGGEEDELNLSRVSDIKEIKLGDFNGFYYISKGRFGPYKDIFLHLKKGVILKINVSISGDQDGFYKKEVDRILPSLRKTFVLEKEVLGPQEKEPIINDTYNFDYMAFDQGVINMEGRAIGNWYFEGSFVAKLLDSDFNVLAETIVHANGDWMTEDYVPFEFKLEYDPGESEAGVLILEKNNPSGLIENEDFFMIRILFKG